MESFIFWGFDLHAWITIVTVLTMFSVMLFTKLRADTVFLGAIGVLFVTGVLDAKEAFSGFGSTSVVVIGVLFVVVAGLTHTGVLQWIVKHLLGQPSTYSKAVVRLMLPVQPLARSSAIQRWWRSSWASSRCGQRNWASLPPNC